MASGSDLDIATHTPARPAAASAGEPSQSSAPPPGPTCGLRPRHRAATRRVGASNRSDRPVRWRYHLLPAQVTVSLTGIVPATRPFSVLVSLPLTVKVDPLPVNATEVPWAGWAAV